MTTTSGRGRRLERVTRDGASVTIEFRYLNEATKEQAKAVARWLREVAGDLEKGARPTKCAPLYHARFMGPLGAGQVNSNVPPPATD